MLSEARQPNTIWSTLAGMRFLFALWVLFAHTYNFGPAIRAMPAPSKSGLTPVLCFLIISGFSIHHSIRSNPHGFGSRRFWRIVPTSTVSVLLALLGYWVFGPNLYDGYGTPYPMPTVWQWIGCLLLLQSVLPIWIPVLFPAWSLSIEAIYYLLAPFIRRQETGTILLAAAISWVLFCCWLLIKDSYIAGETYLIAASALVWAWLVGWIAYSNPRNVLVAAASILAGLCAIKSQPLYFQNTNMVAQISNYGSWTITVLIVFFPDVFSLKRRFRTIDYLGEISFPIYIIHYPVLFILTSSVLKTHPGWNFGWVHTIAAIAAGAIVYHCVDHPLRSRRQIFRAASSPLPAADPAAAAESRP